MNVSSVLTKAYDTGDFSEVKRITKRTRKKKRTWVMRSYKKKVIEYPKAPSEISLDNYLTSAQGQEMIAIMKRGGIMSWENVIARIWIQAFIDGRNSVRK